MTPAAVNINGRLTDAAHAAISPFDHGFLYGYGVYETLRTYNRVPFLFDRHMKRLRASADAIYVPMPVTDGEMLKRIEDTMAAVPGLQEGYIRILLTRGA